MRKILLASILFICGVSYALHIEGIGNRTFIDNDGDTLFIFASNPEFKSNVGPINWYRLPDTTNAFTENAEYFDLAEHGEGYAIKVDSIWEYFWVFDYEQLRAQLDTVFAEPSCDATELTLEGSIPPIQYYNANKQLTTYLRQCHVIYKDIHWDDEQDDWVDSTAIAEENFVNYIVLEPNAIATNYIVVDQLAVLLELDEDSLQSLEHDPIAIKAHPQAIVTTRPKEKSNEVERPTEAEPGLKIRGSGAIEVEFRANAKNADYYTWEIYKGSELLLTRNETQHKFTFEEPGAYTAKVKIANNHGCEYESDRFEITISESMLQVPNVFTPNGDGTHDEFRVVYRSIKEFHCQIYNRWGHLVYEWTDPAKGWDGTINGKPAAAGAYYYVIRALGTDAGQAEYMAKPKYNKLKKKQELPDGVHQLSGDINLLR